MCARVCQHKYPNGSITKYGSSGAGSVFSNISFILFSPWCTGRLKLQITPTPLQRCPSVFHSGRPIQSSQGTRLRLTIPFHDPKFCFHWVDVLPVLNVFSFFDFSCFSPCVLVLILILICVLTCFVIVALLHMLVTQCIFTSCYTLCYCDILCMQSQLKGEGSNKIMNNIQK